MGRWVAGIVLLCVAVAVAEADVTVRLTDVPREIRLPLPDGGNVVLAARVSGDVRSVWLATGRDAKARYLLDDVGDGVYQVNLAEPVLSAMLEAAGPGRVRVFAEATDGTVAESVAIRYAVRAPIQEWVRPPRVFVHTREQVTDVTRLLEWMDRRTLALVAEIHGQGMEFTVPGMSTAGIMDGGERATAWFDPAEVKLIEVRFEPGAHAMAVRASTGEQEWACERADDEEPKLQLAVTDAVRKAWEEHGKLVVTCKQQGIEGMRVVLAVPPKRLDLPEGEGKLVVVQRHRELIPGSDGYVILHIDDVTGGQTLLDLMTADGKELVKRKSVKRGETVSFPLGENEYDLTMTKMVNLLIGDDYCEFVVKPHAEPGEEPVPTQETRAPMNLSFSSPPVRSYGTRFALDENPISEGGIWLNGRADGIDWYNVITENGDAFGAVTSGGFTDPTALLKGKWGRNQVARATVFSRNQTSRYNQEVEFRLRSTLGPHVCTGYEVFWRCLQDKDAYAEIVRWNGKVGDWTSLCKHSGAEFGVKDGDLVEASIVGNVIKGYVNGVEVISAVDDTWTDGSPGIGFNFGVGETNRDFGLTGYHVDTYDD